MYLEVIYSKIGGGDLQRGLSAPSPPKHPIAKFWCGAHVRTDAQIKFLYYPLAGSVKRANSLFKNESVQKNKPAHFQLTSCNGEAISTEFITDCCVGFKMMQNSIPSYKCQVTSCNQPLCFRHLLSALFVYNAFFKFLCGIFTSEKIYKFTCYFGGSPLNWPKFIKSMSLFIHTVYMSWQLCWYLSKS